MKAYMYVKMPVINTNVLLGGYLRAAHVLARAFVTHLLQNVPISTGNLWSGLFEIGQEVGVEPTVRSRFNSKGTQVPTTPAPGSYAVLLNNRTAELGKLTADLDKYSQVVYRRFRFFYQIDANPAHSDPDYAAENEYGRKGGGQRPRPWRLNKAALDSALDAYALALTAWKRSGHQEWLKTEIFGLEGF